jgi:hypothetical protein
MPDSGMVALTDSCVLYTPDPEFIEGWDTICIIICDASICDTAIIIIQLEPLLPVRWLSFQAEKSGSKAMLNWTTADEINNAGFDHGCVWADRQGIAEVFRAKGLRNASRFAK